MATVASAVPPVRIVFIGDEVSAAGYRLAGAETYVPARGEEAAVFAAARTRAALVLVTAEYAARLPAAELSRAQAALAPLTLVIPDVRARVAPADLGRLVRQQLGMEA
jgi:vacuolar-type H+-ATPase subunit F/Vma7